MPGEAGGASDLGQLWAAVDAFFPSIYLSSQVRLLLLPPPELSVLSMR